MELINYCQQAKLLSMSITEIDCKGGSTIDNSKVNHYLAFLLTACVKQNGFSHDSLQLKTNV